MPSTNSGAGYFIYVSGISEVYSYYVPQGQSMFFMDRNQPILYIKTVEVFGQQTVETYDITKRTNQFPVSETPQTNAQPVGQTEFVRKDELSSIVAEAVRAELRSQNNFRKNRSKEND